MVLDNRNMINALKKMVVKTPTTALNNRSNSLNTDVASHQGHAVIKKATCVKLDIEDDDLTPGTELLNRDRPSVKEKIAQRKRAVSECASIIADPSQASGAESSCLAWPTWLPTLLRIPCLGLCLYLFVCSLEVLATSFRLMAGRAAGSIFSDNPLLTNPVVGVMLGVLFTVLVQSSSTCTSVIVSMVASGIVQVEAAIPMIMGANIGTSLTNTLVSFSQLTDRDQFERAFAGATVHDCFNWLSVTVLLSFEVCTGYMYKLTGWLTEHLQTSENNSSVQIGQMNLLGAITKPLTSRIIQIKKEVLKCWALGGCQEKRLLKVWCPAGQNKSDDNFYNIFSGLKQENPSAVKCDFILNIEAIPDLYLGILIFILTLASLSTCLILIVKLLHSLLQGRVSEVVRSRINAEVPGYPWLSGYCAILAGAALTFILQSSSVFTSTITPLVGMGLISVDRMYPLTLGSNIGTTTTALLASLSADPSMLRYSVQIALCHLTFNVHGILLFYPIPAMRWPLVMCKILGRTTAKYRWFAILYLLLMFLVCPGLILLLSLAGGIVLASVLIPTLVLLASIIVINVLQNSRPSVLPRLLQSWSFLPEPLRSLDPLDRILSRYACFGNYAEIPAGPPAPPPEATPD